MSAAPLVVAIDGPAGAGKSTIARRLADALGWAWLDTGAMYRAVTLVALDRGLDLGDPAAVAGAAAGLDLALEPSGRIRADGVDVSHAIRSARVTEAVSLVASLPAVREVMVAHQRRFAARQGRVVAEGRDIGTVVFPDAAVKVWLDAAPEARARRRQAQEGGAGPVDEVLDQIQRRDRLDRSRPVAPLRPAPGAWALDTTRMTLDEVFAAVLSHVRSRIPRCSNPEATS